MVVEEPDTMVKQTTDNKNEEDVEMRTINEAKTTNASTDNQSQRQREKEKSPQPEEKLEATTSNETGKCNQETTLEDTTANTSKAPKGSHEKKNSRLHDKRTRTLQPCKAGKQVKSKCGKHYQDTSSWCLQFHWRRLARSNAPTFLSPY